MDLKVLLASFALVFVAELGDKTQLAALTFTTSSQRPWMVFLGTSLALVTATALAVLLGDLLSRVLPPHVLQVGSGILFVLMGVILLVSVALREKTPAVDEEHAEPVAESRSRAAVFGLVVSQAATFEHELIEQLEALLRVMPRGIEKDTIRQVVNEDRLHMASLQQLRERHQPVLETSGETMTPDQIVHVTEHAPMRGGDHVAGRETRARILQAVEAEQGLAEFYLALARMAKIGSVRDAFRLLATEDLRHAQRLHSLIASDSDRPSDGC